MTARVSLAVVDVQAARNWQQYFAAANQLSCEEKSRRQRRGTAHSRALDFGSNDYLGLSMHPDVLRAARDSFAQECWGSGASPVIGGYREAHRDLERALCDLFGFEDCMTFTSGYACNAGTLASLADRNDLILSDQLNHASLIDGCRLSRAECVVYPHLDIEFVASFLSGQRQCYRRVLIVTESIFSMDGDAAPLAGLSDLAQRYECGLVVDEAHAVGVYGKTGCGLTEELELSSTLLLKLGTLSKAIGSCGGYAGGSGATVEFLVNRCRSYLFSTAAPAAVAAASLAAVRLLPSLSEQRQRLRQQATAVRQRLRDAGWRVAQGDCPIIALIVGDNETALQLSKGLQQQHISVPAIRPPTVAVGTARLRISITAYHQDADIDRLVDALGVPPTT